MLPRVLKNFNVIVDGHPMAGVAEELELPDLDRKMDEYRGGGMLGEVSLDLGLEKLSLTFTLAQFDLVVLNNWGVWGASGLGVRFLGAARADDDAGAVEAIEVAGRGRWKKIELGSVKTGDRSKMKIEMPLTYYRYRSNSRDIIEIDLINNIERVNGTDRQATVNQAIGLSL
ncbi:phage major tail tube protein [Pararhodospirillum photometricum]|uniref:Phage major tail tube protein (Probable bacteriophage tail tube protein FII) n=1 Tax=Pararhodospirillum photometricum DSM 122 TaxID=1150469 RepID=H6SQI7_PARPM|nr:phage major tail tube protein [Pararhodospirillum photometricum]CCG09706.1 Phage major tail tube protein (Probable bacteriophage tail tube protein FII) [Pararhodospirillum photometricum DSM 122]